jgi:hypothetical protein
MVFYFFLYDSITFIKQFFDIFIFLNSYFQIKEVKSLGMRSIAIKRKDLWEPYDTNVS